MAKKDSPNGVLTDSITRMKGAVTYEFTAQSYLTDRVAASIVQAIKEAMPADEWPESKDQVEDYAVLWACFKGATVNLPDGHSIFFGPYVEWLNGADTPPLDHFRAYLGLASFLLQDFRMAFRLVQIPVRNPITLDGSVLTADEKEDIDTGKV